MAVRAKQAFRILHSSATGRLMWANDSGGMGNNNDELQQDPKLTPIVATAALANPSERNRIKAHYRLDPVAPSVTLLLGSCRSPLVFFFFTS